MVSIKSFRKSRNPFPKGFRAAGGFRSAPGGQGGKGTHHGFSLPFKNSLNITFCSLIVLTILNRLIDSYFNIGRIPALDEVYQLNVIDQVPF